MDSDCINHNWYVVYTYPKAERKVDRKLKEIGITTFLPLHIVNRQWSDRKKKLEVPLFPNYLFVHIAPDRQYKVLQVKGIVRFISFEGKPTIIPELEIDSIRKIIDSGLEIASECLYEKGTMVKITNELFSGATGLVLRKGGKRRLIIRVTALKQSISVSLPADCVEAAIS